MSAGQSGGVSGKPVRAAQYVRMSTEHQKYSTENQAEALQHYAAQRGIEIVRTYADEGKSGLSLDGRDALKRLIEDVQAKRTDFTTILVYESGSSSDGVDIRLRLAGVKPNSAAMRIMSSTWRLAMAR